MSDKPRGKPYSQVYVERGPAVEDSKRFRNRLCEYLRDFPDGRLDVIAKLIAKKTGEPVFYDNIARHFKDCSLQDLLDNITHTFKALQQVSRAGYPETHQMAWLNFVTEALEDGNLGYVVDENGGVHPAHDGEFDASRRATISLLEGPRYTAARKFFDAAMGDLKQPLDTRDAIRKTFEAVENVAKLMCPNDIARLTATEVRRFVQAIALKDLEGTERNSTSRMVESLAEWVNACQQYRHAAGEPEPDQPSLDLAIYMVSTGAAHLRWLITLDQKTVAK